MNIKQEGIEVLGSQEAFAYSTHVWRRTLELLRDAYVGAPMAEEEQVRLPICDAQAALFTQERRALIWLILHNRKRQTKTT